MVDVGCDDRLIHGPGYCVPVSILVVVDVGCDGPVAAAPKVYGSGFNPCCGGCRM